MRRLFAELQGASMRGVAHAIGMAIVLVAGPALAQAAPDAPKAFWHSVQSICDATAVKPPSDLAERIAQATIDEYVLFGGHQIDANGQLVRFGTTAAGSEDQRSGPRAVS